MELVFVRGSDHPLQPCLLKDEMPLLISTIFGIKKIVDAVLRCVPSADFTVEYGTLVKETEDTECILEKRSIDPPRAGRQRDAGLVDSLN